MRAVTNKIVECVCKCGSVGQVSMYDLIYKKSQRCRACATQYRGKRTHNLSNTRIYKLWKNVKDRCYRAKSAAYENYGGRGIKVCDKWLNDFMAFYDWAMNNGYKDSLTIDRIDNDGNYEPSNCRWATKAMQNNNTRRNHYIDYQDKRYTLSELAHSHGLEPLVVYKRLKRGWSIDEAISIKLNGRRKGNEKYWSCA